MTDQEKIDVRSGDMCDENVELDTQVVDISYHNGEEEMDQNGVPIPRISQFFK